MFGVCSKTHLKRTHAFGIDRNMRPATHFWEPLNSFSAALGLLRGAGFRVQGFMLRFLG